MHQFIEKVVDVVGDGHCGFRAVAGLRDMFVDDYQIILYELLRELTGVNRDRYFRLIGSEHRFNEVKNALTDSGIGVTPSDKWMTMPDMGFLIAQRYRKVVVIVSINKGKSETFFHLCGATTHRMMCLAYVNNIHFMMVYLKDGCPIPPTSVLWARHCHDDARTWDARYVERMVAYNALSRMAGYEVVGDEDLYVVENIAESQEKLQSQSLRLDDCSIDLLGMVERRINHAADFL